MRDVIHSPEAPEAVGPYSQAIRAGGLVWVSGQIPLDPASGEVVEGSIEEQAHRVLRNLSAVLREAGSGLERVVRTTVYLTDLNDFAAVNAVYQGYFEREPPARACVEVSRLPKGVAIEIDAVALVS